MEGNIFPHDTDSLPRPRPREELWRMIHGVMPKQRMQVLRGLRLIEHYTRK